MLTLNKLIFPFILIMFCVMLGLVPAVAQETDVFPVTIEHQFGSTTITEAPQRIVSIGYTEQDFLLALGITPIAVRYWYGDETNAIFPWAEDKVEGETPIVLNMPYGNLNYEAILALQPDLISAVTAGISAEEYETLSQIAPTITQSGDYINFGMPWQVVMRMIGEAVGKSTEAEVIVADTEALFADARAKNPQFEEKSIAVAYYYGDTYGFYTAQDSRGRFFTELGFVVPDELIEIAGDSFYADISTERVELLDQDLIAIVNLQFIEGGRETLEANPLFSQLNAVQEGRVLYLEEQAENALGFSSPLSLAYALDAALPQLEAIFGTSTAATCDEGFRLFTHAAGESCVPENVERVVTLEWTYAENLLALGLQPVGVADIAGYNNWVQIPLELDASVADVGTRQEPNLEAIAALEPDLILAVSFRAGQNYELLSAIAPTLVFDAYPTDMTHYEEMIATFNIIAQATGREAEAEDVLQAMRDTFAAANDALNDAGRAGETFILAQTFASGDTPTFRLFTDNALAVQTLAQIGLVNAWEDAPQQFGFTTVDFEAFANIGDTNFFYVAQDDYHPTLTGSPLWGGLPFVQSDRAYWLGGDAWLFGGPLSMQVVVDTVLTAMGIDLPEVTDTP
jgi:iron complex transport system substrate-binding protein